MRGSTPRPYEASIARGVLYAFVRAVNALPERCLRRRAHANPLFGAPFRITVSSCYVSAVRLHVTAADALVRARHRQDDFRYPPIGARGFLIGYRPGRADGVFLASPGRPVVPVSGQVQAGST